MSNILRFFRGTTAKNNAYIGPEGSITIDTERKTIRVHDGVTAGGVELLTPSTLDLQTLPNASTTQAGIVQLNDTLTSTSTSLALTAAQGKILYDSKLASSSYTAADVLTKIKTVDGATSGLDADLLDGQEGSYYLNWSNITNKPDPTITVSLTGDVTGTANTTLTDLASGSISITSTVTDDSHNHTTLTGVTAIGFAAQSTDLASISTTISGTSTFFDFNLTDDNNNDWWRWRFTPSGQPQYDAMTLKPVSNTEADLYVSGKVGIGIQTPSYKLHVNGSFAATTKSFVIPHPTKDGMRLRYGSLEGPENGVYIRGKLKQNNVIELPEYWTKLVDKDSITVDLTPFGRHQTLFVKEIIDNKVFIGNSTNTMNDINCFYTVWAERIDVDKLEVEII